MKIPPLVCPQCQSPEVSPGFTKQKGRAFVRDSKIYCYACKQVTDTKTGKVQKHEYSPNRMDGVNNRASR